MWDILFNNIPLTIIVIIAVIICGAELVKAISYLRSKGKERSQKKQQGEDILKDIQSSLKSLHDKVDANEERLIKSEQRIKDLTVSDMHDIKSWLVNQYMKFYVHQKEIDAYNAEIIERRYEDYKKEGGNSYIDTLMERMRTLPVKEVNEID